MLRRLYLARNKLRNLPSLTSRTLPHFVVLDVHGNQLINVEKDAFSGLVSLERVNLGQNYLQYLPMKRVFEQNARLRVLHLEGNPWTCDCRQESQQRI